MAIRQLNRRCGPLGEAATARIQTLPLDQLEALAEALLDFTGADDLANWLAEHAFRSTAHHAHATGAA